MLFKAKEKREDEYRPVTEFIESLAPNTGDLSNPKHIRIGDRYIRSLYIDGWPYEIDFGYLHPLVSFAGDIDFAQYISPVEKEKMIRWLTDRIEGIESKLIERAKQVSSRGVRAKRDELALLDQLRADIENNRDRIIYFDNFVTIAAPSIDELEKKVDRLMAKFGGTKDHLKLADDEHDLMWKAVSPLGIKTKHAWKEMNLDAGTNLYPFTISDWPHEKGPLIGLNYDTGSPILFDGFNKEHVKNYGIAIIGVSGTGKSAMLKKILAGEVRYDIFQAVLDQDNEFRKAIETLGGVYLPINRHTDLRFNPADIEEEYNHEYGKSIVDLNGKIEDMTNLASFMAGLTDNKEDKIIEAYIDKAWRKAYAAKGITEDPNSLYEEGFFDENTKKFIKRNKKLPPRFSDFYHIFCEMAEGIPELKGTVISLERYTADGTLGLFDCYTNVELAEAPCIGFGMKELKNSLLRPIANIVVMTYLENRFIKKRSEDEGSLFRIIADECQEFLDNPYSAKALETFFRRFRKRKGGPIAATQNFQKFYENEHGRAIVQNSDTKIIFGQHEGDLKYCAEMFNLTEGEVEFLSLGTEHHAIIKQPKYSCRSVTQFSPWEQEIFFPEHGG
ncbi:hypothetical protein L1765_10105 [Microaerobacter geothermalis]|uniref:VirB4 family type IV secretion system protein n=1 Tax=Microaerobacter geothermalis TaxID=674972 RepID=UPI001F47655D|nr:hypothetical protein [Microaerobacter geothermalis]MCF6094315.1 hypothetical protein [Microaerobacter geothermalis]